MMTAVQASVVAFGSNLCSRIAGHINIKGAFYVLLATLALAVYNNYATLWYCSGFALLTGTPAASGQPPAILAVCLT